MPERGNSESNYFRFRCLKHTKVFLEYCDRKGYKKNGSGLDAEFTREEDLKPVRNRLKKYVDQPFKVYEKFIILEQELKE